MNNAIKTDYRLLSEWTKEFSELYKKHDKTRSPEEIWISTMAYGSQIGEAMRTASYRDLIRAAAHGFCWMCTFVTECNTTSDLLFKCENDFCDMVFLKFPGKCGHCDDDRCRCKPFEMDAKTDKAAEYKKLYNKHWKHTGPGGRKYSLSDWVSTFRDIFGTQIYLQALEILGFHFLEEMGEEAQALRELVQLRGVLEKNINGVNKKFLEKISNIPGLVEEYESCMNKVGKDDIDITSDNPDHIKSRIVKAKMDLVIEFADTFSWFCAILIKLEWMSNNLNIGAENYDIEIFLEKEYGKKGEAIKCPSCKNADCKCLFFPKN